MAPVLPWQVATEPVTDNLRATIIPGRQAVSDTRGGPELPDWRMLSLRLSHPDSARLVVACGKAEEVVRKVVQGASNNSRGFGGRDDREGLDWAPRDSADVYANRLLGKANDDRVAEECQGGIYRARV